jgi:hypothetical protein
MAAVAAAKKVLSDSKLLPSAATAPGGRLGDVAGQGFEVRGVQLKQFERPLMKLLARKVSLDKFFRCADRPFQKTRVQTTQCIDVVPQRRRCRQVNGLCAAAL